MLSPTPSQQWTKTIEFYEELGPQHRQEPMKTLVKAVAKLGAENALWPTHSHLMMRVFADSLEGRDANMMASVSAEYWHNIDKFHLRYFNIQGIPYDEKWCDLGEAEATLRHIFRLLREDRDAASNDNRA